MQAAAARLIACLFYIELLSTPTFYTTTEYVQVLLRCRLPEGQQLLCLVKGLFHLKALVHHHGDEAQPTSEVLVTSKLLRTCYEGKPFFKHLQMKANGLHTKLDIKIDGISGGKESISNCPYQVGKLITDQGLHQIFGSEHHRMSNEPPDPGYNATDGLDISRLHDTLDNIIVSYSKLTESIYSPDGTHPALKTPKSLSTARRKGVAGNSFSGWI